VEFSDAELYGYEPGQASHLGESLPSGLPLVFEAHSTDYQTTVALAALVADHFAILKVGPGLTFAYREALFALSFIEDQLLGEAASGVRQILDRAMLDAPQYWLPFYPKDPEAARFARRYSRSDRSRYYWPVPVVQEAVARLHRNLEATDMPAEIVSQFMPWAAEIPGIGDFAVRSPDWLLRAAVRRVLAAYLTATG